MNIKNNVLFQRYSRSFIFFICNVMYDKNIKYCVIGIEQVLPSFV